MANIFRIKIRSLFLSLIITSICSLVRSFIRVQLFINVQFRVYGRWKKKCGQKNIEEEE